MGSCLSKSPEAETAPQRSPPENKKVVRNSVTLQASFEGSDGVFYFGFRSDLQKHYSISRTLLGKGSYGMCPYALESDSFTCTHVRVVRWLTLITASIQ